MNAESSSAASRSARSSASGAITWAAHGSAAFRCSRCRTPQRERGAQHSRPDSQLPAQLVEGPLRGGPTGQADGAVIQADAATAPEPRPASWAAAVCGLTRRRAESGPRSGSQPARPAAAPLLAGVCLGATRLLRWPSHNSSRRSGPPRSPPSASTARLACSERPAARQAAHTPEPGRVWPQRAPQHQARISVVAGPGQPAWTGRKGDGRGHRLRQPGDNPLITPPRGRSQVRDAQAAELTVAVPDQPIGHTLEQGLQRPADGIIVMLAGGGSRRAVPRGREGRPGPPARGTGTRR